MARNNGSTLLYNTLMGNPDAYNNAIGRTSGSLASSGSGDNFFAKRGRSIENAFGTTGAAIASAFKSGIGILGGPQGGGSENIATQEMRRSNKQSMNDIARKFGYNSWDDWQDASEMARQAGDTEAIKRFDEQLKEFQAQANANANKATEKVNAYKDYVDNNYVSKKINQDQGKFAGSAINTLSTAVDLTGLTANPLGNAVQGGIEGVADELEQNGLENFDWGRAGQNAAVGATTGLVTGALNKGISNSLAKRAAAKGLTNTATKAGIGNAIKQGAKTIAGGAARGALSGAVGGATGAGLQSAMNSVEFGQGVQNALQGAVQGAQQGAVTGGIMAGANMAISKTPGVGKFYNELQSAKSKWDQSGSNFDERLTNTLTSGDSAVGDWLMNKRQSNVLSAAGSLGNRVQDVSDLQTMLTDIRQRAEKLDANRDDYGMPDESWRSDAYGYEELLNNPQTRKVIDSLELTHNPTAAQAAAITQYLRDNGYLDTPTTAKGWAKKAGQRIVEDANNKGVGLSTRDVSQDDIANMQVNRNDMLDINANARTMDPWDRVAQEAGYATYDDVIDAYMRANPNATINQRGMAGQILSWLDQNPNTPTTASEWATRAGQRVVEEANKRGVGLSLQDTSEDNPQTRLYNELTSKKSNTENRLRNAAGLKLQAQYGTIDKPTAKATNAPETLQKIAKAGFTKPADVERMADVVTGSNGEVSKLVSNLVETAKPINTFNGETDSQTIDDFIDLAIQKRGLDGINEGKAVKSQLKAIMKSLPSHADGSITFVDNPTDVFKLTQLLDSEAANYEGRSGMNYGTTTPDKLRAAQVLKDVSNLYKNRIYDTVDVKKVLTPEVAENLKSYAPGNAEWANYVDKEIMTATSAKDLRSVQAPWVRAKKIIDNGYMNSVTFGGRNSGLTGNIPLTKRGIVGAVLGATVNSKPGLRAQAKVLNKAADFVGGTQPDTTAAPANPVVASPAELANATANYNPSTQLYNAIGRTEGLSNADQARTAGYITEATQDAQAGYAEPLGVSATTPASTSIYNSLYQTPTTTQEVVTTAPGSYFQPTGDYWTDILAKAVSSAIDANDVTAFSSLYGMYQDAVSGLQKQAQTTNTSNLNATQQANLAKLDAADSAIDELEDLFENAGGGKGPIVGNLQSLAGDWGWDSGARTYNDMSEGLVNQIAAAIGKTDSLNTEGEVRRALKLIPQLTDDATTAKNKLEELRRMLATTKASYNSAYGLVQ